MKYYSKRLEKLKAILNKNNLDGMITNNLNNIRYLCGFSGSSGTCLILNENNFFISDGRYKIQSQLEVKNMDIIIENESNINSIKNYKLLKTKNLRLGFESNNISYSTLTLLKTIFPYIIWVPISNTIEEIAMLKDPYEIQCIKKSVKITDQAFDQIIPDISVGINEKEIAAKISFALKILGADDDAFKPIVAGGSNSALPHAVPSDRKLQKGDFLILDFGAKYNGYNSDMTRTVVIKECSDHQKEIYDIVYESQKLGINASSDSIDCKYLDYVCRNYIELNGFGDKFIHNTGHGLGLAVHENPRFSKNSNEKIYTDYVMTIEPGVYIEGFGGVRIEDDVLIKKSGCEVLNKSQKDLLILD